MIIKIFVKYLTFKNLLRTQSLYYVCTFLWIDIGLECWIFTNHQEFSSPISYKRLPQLILWRNPKCMKIMINIIYQLLMKNENLRNTFCIIEEFWLVSHPTIIFGLSWINKIAS
jgi:hypothetical protein